MKLVSRVSILSVTLLWLSACATSAPPQPPYEGADSVGLVDGRMLIGTWKSRVLNPPANAPKSESTVQYHADGRVTGFINKNGEMSASMGNMSFEMSGNWRTEGNLVSVNNVTMKSTSNDAASRFIGRLVNFASQGIEGKADVYELSANRMVTVSTETGVANEFIRQ